MPWCPSAGTFTLAWLGVLDTTLGRGRHSERVLGAWLCTNAWHSTRLDFGIRGSKGVQKLLAIPRACAPCILHSAQCTASGDGKVTVWLKFCLI
jgi:hypothetical protein